MAAPEAYPKISVTASSQSIVEHACLDTEVKLLQWQPRISGLRAQRLALASVLTRREPASSLDRSCVKDCSGRTTPCSCSWICALLEKEKLPGRNVAWRSCFFAPFEAEGQAPCGDALSAESAFPTWLLHTFVLCAPWFRSPACTYMPGTKTRRAWPRYFTILPAFCKSAARRYPRASTRRAGTELVPRNSLQVVLASCSVLRSSACYRTCRRRDSECRVKGALGMQSTQSPVLYYVGCGCRFRSAYWNAILAADANQDPDEVDRRH